MESHFYPAMLRLAFRAGGMVDGGGLIQQLAWHYEERDMFQTHTLSIDMDCHCLLPHPTSPITLFV